MYIIRDYTRDYTTTTGAFLYTKSINHYFTDVAFITGTFRKMLILQKKL